MNVIVQAMDERFDHLNERLDQLTRIARNHEESSLFCCRYVNGRRNSEFLQFPFVYNNDGNPKERLPIMQNCSLEYFQGINTHEVINSLLNYYDIPFNEKQVIADKKAALVRYLEI